MTTLCNEVEIPVPWGNISGKWWGPRDKQPVLFLHGWQDNASTFDRLIPLLPNDISFLCIDFPGHGLSSHYPKGQYYYLFWDGVVIVRRVVKHFGWEKVSIVGHSLGGAVGFMYASSFPDEVEKLVSLDIACPRVTKPSVLAKQSGEHIDRFLKYETLSSHNQPCYEYDEMVNIALDGYKGSVSKDGMVTLMSRGMKPAESKDGYYFFCRDVRLKVAALAMPSLDIVLEMADRIRCNYLNIRALDGLKLESPEVYPLMMERIKNACNIFCYHEVEGTHHVHLNNPDRIADILGNFLSRDPPTDSYLKSNSDV